MCDTSVNRGLFALIVAINVYKNKGIRPLQGSVNDGNAFRKFLGETLHVPDDQVMMLVDDKATRAGILKAFFEHFIENSDIKRGDTIVFFFAGHGDRMEAPPSWQTGGVDGLMVETICPYDESTEEWGGDYVFGIPDRTFEGLIRRLAHEKGDNIVRGSVNAAESL